MSAPSLAEFQQFLSLAGRNSLRGISYHSHFRYTNRTTFRIYGYKQDCFRFTTTGLRVLARRKTCV